MLRSCQLLYINGSYKLFLISLIDTYYKTCMNIVIIVLFIKFKNNYELGHKAAI